MHDFGSSLGTVLLCKHLLELAIGGLSLSSDCTLRLSDQLLGQTELLVLLSLVVLTEFTTRLHIQLGFDIFIDSRHLEGSDSAKATEALQQLVSFHVSGQVV